jgi:hypothetical protein
LGRRSGRRFLTLLSPFVCHQLRGEERNKIILNLPIFDTNQLEVKKGEKFKT